MRRQSLLGMRRRTTGQISVESRNSVFFAFSPYHFLLSVAIASNMPSRGEKHLVLFSDSQGAKSLARVARQWDRSPFTSVTLFPGAYGLASLPVVKPALLAILAKQNVRYVRRIIDELKPDHVCVFGDKRIECQAAIHYGKSIDEDTIAMVAEDGSADYSSALIRPRGRVYQSLIRAIFGRWWEEVRAYGTYSRTDEVHVTFPSLVRDELKARRLLEIPRVSLTSAMDAEFVDAYCEAMGFDPSSLSEIRGLVLLDHSSVGPRVQEYLSIVRRVIPEYGVRGANIAFKCHPRETSREPLSELGGDAHVVVPAALPVEIVYLAGQRSLELVVGNKSTGILTAKWLLPETRVLSLALATGGADPRLLRVFERIGVELVSNQ